MKTPEEFLTRGKGNFINCTDYDDAIEAMKDYAEQEVAKVISSNPPVRFQLPSDKQMIEIAILFNDGKLEQQKLADMVGYGQFIVDRLYENGDVGKPSSKEEGN